MTMNNFPKSYILMPCRLYDSNIEEFLKYLFKNYNLQYIDDYVAIAYNDLNYSYVLEALNSYMTEGFNLVVYCSNVVNDYFEFQFDLENAINFLKNKSVGIYGYKDVNLEHIVISCDDILKKYVLKQYYNDEEMLNIIDVLFDQNLNVSKASKVLYMHRNTLMYKLDKFLDVTGYDLREFKDACFIEKIIK